MQIKSGVDISNIKLPMRKVLAHGERIWQEHDQELVITSGREGNHSAASYHHFGYALDFRIRYFDIDTRNLVADKLQISLGHSYLVVLESDHIHVQFNANSTGKGELPCHSNVND